MHRRLEFTISSELAAPRPAVWAVVSTMAGVNHELWPLLQMTYPGRYASLDAAELPRGRRAFRSWILLLGLLPVDYDDLTILELWPGQGFQEKSPMLSNRRWRHRRVLADTERGCRAVDTIAFEPRIAPLGPLQLALYLLVFAHRHRRLRQRFGWTAP